MTALAETVFKVSLTLTAALVIAAALRRRSAALRHWVLSVGIVCAVATPVLMPIVPAWHAPLGLGADRSSRAETIAIPLRDPAEGRAVAAAVPPRNTTVAPVRRFSMAELAALVWLMGSATALMALLGGLFRLSRMRSRARLLRDAMWDQVLRDVAERLGIRRPVALLKTEHPSLLFTWGHFRPIVMLPRDAGEWAAERVRIVLCHELSHVRRGDWLTLLAAETLRAAYWFNPLAWLIGKQLRDESERACDDEVMRQGVDGTVYASELLSLARILNAERTGWVAAPAMARRSSLERRVGAMMNTQINRQPLGGWLRATIVGVLLALAAAIGGFSAAAQAFASFSGSVLDATNNVVTGVTVTMSNKQTGQKYEVTSGDNGAFEFVGLTPGDYELETQIAGFNSIKKPMTITGKNVRSDVHLEVGSLEETISVIDRGEARVDGAGPTVRTGAFRARPSCEPKPTGGMIVQPRKIADARPIYPRSGGAAKAVGVVVLDARIGADGSVVEARGVDPAADPDLVAAAIEAVTLWKYTPVLLNCVPVEVEMKVTVNFRTE